MRSVVIGGVALVAALVLVGCTGQGEGTTSPSSSSSNAGPTMPDLDQFTPPPSGVIDEDTQEAFTPKPVPTWDETSRNTVVAAAEKALWTFAQPGLDYDTWWAGLEPLLTPSAAVDYAHVDPANIPMREVIGKGIIVEDSSAYAATVEVPTDIGPYHVLLIRQDATAPWLVSRISPKESE